MRTRILLRGLLPIALVSAALAQGGFGGPGWYEIANVQSGKVLSLDRDMSGVTQFPRSNGENQAWFFQPADSGFFYIRNGVNGNTLEPTAGANRSIVLAAPFHGTPSQQWRLEGGKDGSALIVNHYGKTLDLPNGTSRGGVPMQIYDRNGNSNQRFVLRPLNGEFGARWRGEGRGEGRRENGNAVTCASDHGQRKYCEADTREGVRLVRRISGAPCRLDETWGFDRRGIWVDRGCAAEFQTGDR